MDIRRDDWFSDIFGYGVYLVEPRSDAPISTGSVEHAITEAIPPGRSLLFAKVATTDIDTVHLLTASGFGIVDVNVTFDREPARPLAARQEDIPVRRADAGDLDDLKEIARNAFVYSRFHLDPRTPDKIADKIKAEWVANYVAGNRGEQLLVAELDGKPVGFLCDLARQRNGEALRVIDLIAVAPDAQGTGVGTALVDRFVSDARGDCDRLRVGTQAANVPSLRFYEELGFRTAETRYVLHAHRDTEDRS